MSDVKSRNAMKNRAIRHYQCIKAIISGIYYRHDYRYKSKKATISTIFIIGNQHGGPPFETGEDQGMKDPYLFYDSLTPGHSPEQNPILNFHFNGSATFFYCRDML